MSIDKKGKNMFNKTLFLGLMPFWSPLSPPLGISVLKSYLEKKGIHVHIYDFNTEDELWEMGNKYFNIIMGAIPDNNQMNFYMIGYDVFSNHLTIYIHKKNNDNYYQLIKTLIWKNYYVEIGDNIMRELDRIISEFYSVLNSSLLRIFENGDPDIFGLSVYSTSLGPSLHAFKIIKQKYPHIKTIMGGGIFADHLSFDSPNFSKFLERTESYIDTIIIGEGEILLEKYLLEDFEENKRVYSLKDIDGENLDLNSITAPNFNGLNLSAYSQMAIYATRSCPFQCGFCSETVQWGKFRKKKGTQIAEEIAHIKKNHGGKLFMFGDSLLNPVITEFSHNLIESGINVFGDGYLRISPDLCEGDHVEIWRKAGLYRVRLGIESGSQHVLDLMNKNITVEQIKKAISALAKFGIKTTTYWVIGFPGETEDDFSQTIELLKEIKDDIYEADWHPFYFFPKGQVSSEIWTEKYGIELLYPEEFSDMILTQTWILKTNPAREEIYARLNRFGEACKKLNIPNPYSMMDIYQADKRWKKLHPKAGPTILDLHNYKHV
ncbi:MAG: B12-binding domain-containing radical SAM protein [Candidatus Thorarchaeota archaeon]